MKDVKKLLEVRAEMKRKKPHFKRHDRNKLGRLARSGWRKSVQGHDNKQRNRYAGNEKSPTPGYGSPVDVRGMHPSGFMEIIVHNAAGLNSVNPKEFAVRVAGDVGNRKKIDIVEKAKKMNFKVLNPKYSVKAPKEDKKSDAKKAEEKTRKDRDNSNKPAVLTQEKESKAETPSKKEQKQNS